MGQERIILIVINPVSGKSSYLSKLQYLQDQLNKAGILHSTYFTKRDNPGDLRQFLIANSHHNEIFVIGGDGTLNMVVNEIMPQPVPLAIISNGTGNDSVKSLHGILNFKKQVEIAIHGQTKLFDLGVCNDRYFVNGVGIGFDGEVVKEMVERGDKRGRHIDYLLSVLRILGSFKEKKVKFKLDGSSFERKVLLMTISNGSTFGGGFIINPLAKTNDGLLDVCIINEIPPIKRFWHVPKLKTGAHINIRQAEFHTTKNISVAPSAELAAHLDGEYIGQPPFEISILHKVLPVKVPV